MATETLRPNADGDSSECTGSDGNQVNNYELIDESSTDDADYVYATGTTDGTWRIDLYNLPSTAIAVGSTINKITFYARFKSIHGEDDCKFAYTSGGTTYRSDAPNVTTSFEEYSWEQTTNQKTSAAFTIDEINALQIGVDLRQTNSIAEYWGVCSQLWIVIEYTTGWAHITKVNGVASANISKVHGIAVANISKVNGVAV